jgi:membrane-associated phospholipid phosphatase
MDKICADKRSLKSFSWIMAIALLLIGTILFVRHRPGYLLFYPLAVLFFGLGVFAAPVLKPLYLIWMRLAFVLSWINTRILLLAVFYLVLTPIGLIMKLMGKDPLDQRIESGRTSYWLSKPQKVFIPAEYERQF